MPSAELTGIAATPTANTDACQARTRIEPLPLPVAPEKQKFTITARKLQFNSLEGAGGGEDCGVIGATDRWFCLGGLGGWDGSLSLTEVGAGGWATGSSIQGTSGYCSRQIASL